MRRPFFWPAIGLSVGILLGRASSLPNRFIFILVFSLLPFLWAFRGRWLFLPLFLVSLAGIGILRVHQAFRLPPDAVWNFARGDWVSLEGKVASLPEVKEKGRRKIDSFVLESRNIVQKREFSEVRGNVQIFLFNPSREAVYGSRVRLRGRLARPKEAQNPGEFDYQKYLTDQGIQVVFEGYGPRSLQILENKSPPVLSPFALLQNLRLACARRIDSLFSFPVNALLRALVLGMRRNLPEELRDDLMKTGTTHLIAISGMNITLVAGSLFFLTLCLGFPQKAAALAGLFSAVGYVFLSGSEMPVVRAGWMAALFFTGLLLEREKDLLNSLFFAFFAILTADPKAFFQVGFQLSFLSVFSLIALTPRRSSAGFAEWFQSGWVLIGTFPVCVVYFSVFSWASLIANLLAIPLFHLGNLGGLGSLAVGRVPFLGTLWIWLTSFFLKAGIAWIQFWAKQPWSYSYLKAPSCRLLIFYYGALALVWTTHRWRTLRWGFARAFSISLWLAACTLFFLPGPGQNFVLTVLALGQNEVLHVEFPGRNHWLVNTGRGAPSNQARWTLSPLLRRYGVRHLQGVLLTDFSRRHTGGLATLFGNFSVGSVLFPSAAVFPPDLDSTLSSSRKRHKLLVPFLEGDQIPIEGRSGFRVLDVTKGQATLLIDYRGGKFLLLPSWSRETLEHLLPRLKDLSSVDVLILPGSGRPADSQWKEILSLLLPGWVIFPKHNPALEPLLDSLKEEEIPFYFLSETGALRFEIGEGKWRISPFH